MSSGLQNSLQAIVIDNPILSKNQNSVQLSLFDENGSPYSGGGGGGLTPVIVDADHMVALVITCSSVDPNAASTIVSKLTESSNISSWASITDDGASLTLTKDVVIMVTVLSMQQQVLDTAGNGFLMSILSTTIPIFSELTLGAFQYGSSQNGVVQPSVTLPVKAGMKLGSNNDGGHVMLADTPGATLTIGDSVTLGIVVVAL